MRRRLTDFLSLNALRHLRYVPLIMARVVNWPLFLWRYLGFGQGRTIFTFRNGAKLKTVNPIDVLTASVVFIKREYGSIPREAIVVDIGANIGSFAIDAATAGAHVYAYEPMPDNYQHLIDNITLNRYQDRIVPFNLGVYAEAGVQRLYLGSESPFHSLYEVGQEEAIDIEVISLVDIFAQNDLKRCDLLKLDCEGAEFDILYNTPPETLAQVNQIRMEYHNMQQTDRQHIDTLLEFLRQHHFYVTKITRDSAYSGLVWLERRG